MKKLIFLIVLSVFMVTQLTAGAAGLPIEADGKRLSAYDYELYMYPVWAGEAVYQECTVFYVDGNGDTVGGSLLYKPETVVSVRTFGLEKEFKEGSDYTVTETGIALTENSEIQVMPRESYCDESNKEYTHQLKDGNGGAIKTDNSVLSKYYLSVTYTTNGVWSGTLPESQLGQIPKTAEKLKNKEPVTIAVLGDSISVGYTTSGLNDPSYRVNGEQITCKVNISPYMPIWPKLLCQALKEAYGYDDITVVNWAIGGTNTQSACLPDMIERVISSNPDLITVGFGMNEFWSPANQHGDRITGILETIRASLSDAEFVLISSMLPNMLAYAEDNMRLGDFEQEYYRIQKERADLPIAVAPLNSVYCYARETKGDFGLLGGNQNHPNDFAARLYAQTVATVLGAYDTPVILTKSVPEGRAGENYLFNLSAYCTRDVNWSAEDLPEGLTLSADGEISGAPVMPGDFRVSLTVSSGERNASAVLELKVSQGETGADTADTDDSGGRSLLWPAPIAVSCAAAALAAAAVIAGAIKKRKNKSK